tara:strand:+ start:4988 stop:6037 length:1050 start_codon:yes stop_codon:yes gene_type:complete
MQTIDIPKKYQKELGGVRAHYGLEMDYLYQNDMYSKHRVLVDKNSNLMLSEQLFFEHHTDDWSFKPNIDLTWTSSHYNTRYYGLKQVRVEDGFSLKFGIDIKYHLVSNLYLTGQFNETLFSHSICKSDLMSSCSQYEYGLGILFAEDLKRLQSAHDESDTQSKKHYLRFAYGIATKASAAEIITFKSHLKEIESTNQMFSVFYGYQVTDRIFSLPIDVYPTVGYVHHLGSSVQSSSEEVVLGMKLYYNFYWPTHMRFGFAEGISYATYPSSTESKEIIEEDGQKPSRFLNYLDLSLDFNVGELFQVPSGNQFWLGYSLHHRSGMFKSSAQYGRTNGGVNFHSIYVQVDF